MMAGTGPLRTWVLSGLIPITLVIVVMIGLQAAPGGTPGLRRSSPAPNAIAPLGLQHLVLSFGSRVDADRSSVTLTMDDGMYLGPARLGVDPEDPTILIATMPARLGVGTYRVDWHAAFGGAHSADGGYSFRVGQPSDNVSRDRNERQAALGHGRSLRSRARGERFQVVGAKVPGDTAQIGFGLATAVFADTSVDLHCDGDLASGASSNAITAGFRLSW